MINLETVLVLGSGASKDFGFPTGQELVRQIGSMYTRPESQIFFNECAGQIDLEKTRIFPRVLKTANPISVDTWLEHNHEFIEIGKIAIAIQLLQSEQKANLNPEKNWYQLLFQRMNCPFEVFQKNKLSIITFNYDRSLEKYLFNTFRYTHKEKGEEECKEMLNQIKIIHVYGSLGRLGWQHDDPNKPVAQVDYATKLDRSVVFSASKSIKIMPEKGELSEEFQEARRWINNAQALYFLGFGYHNTNMMRLGIEILRKPSKIMGTSWGLEYQTIREVERLDIHSFGRSLGLVNASVHEFLHDHVDFNEVGLP